MTSLCSKSCLLCLRFARPRLQHTARSYLTVGQALGTLREQSKVYFLTERPRYLRTVLAAASRCVFSPIVQRRKMGTFNTNVIFRQLFDHQSFTLTYLLGDKGTGEAILIDPVVELVHRDVHLVEDLGLKLVYAVNTHCHADHITGTGELKKHIPSCRSVISLASGAQADIYIEEGDRISFGQQYLDVLATPGHTSGCLTFVMKQCNDQPIVAFTGDAILIRGCGRTDFQEGNSSELYDNVHNKILSLPKNTILYPAHDYTGQLATTVGEEILFNPRLAQPKEKFLKIMDELNLPYPKAIDKALPANMVCGIYETES